MTWHEPQKNHQGKSPRHVEVSAKKGLSSTLRTPLKSSSSFKLYHGTDANFKNFENKYLGYATGTAPINMTGFSFTDNVKVARTFGKNIIEVEIQINKPYIIDAGGKDYSEFKHTLNDILEKVNRKKYDGVIIKNYKDAGKYSHETILSNHYVPFKDSQIKVISSSTIVPKIIDSGYPTNSPSYPSAHKKACGYEISKFGITNFLSLEKVVSKTPKSELLGTHDKEGNIKISSKVPPKFISEVADHEQVEHNLMSIKTWLSDIEAELSAVNGIHSSKKLRQQFRSQWQNEYNYILEQLPTNIQEELTPQILAMPRRIQAKINEYEDD